MWSKTTAICEVRVSVLASINGKDDVAAEWQVQMSSEQFAVSNTQSVRNPPVSDANSGA
jgi:uncharacterized protein YaiE (UPF0345 family)